MRVGESRRRRPTRQREKQQTTVLPDPHKAQEYGRTLHRNKTHSSFGTGEIMSAIKQAQMKVEARVKVGEATLVAGFDFSILITLAMKLLMDYLGNCMATNSAAAEERVKDGFWFSYFARKA